MTTNIESSVPELKFQAQSAELWHRVQQQEEEIRDVLNRLQDLEQVVHRVPGAG